MDRIFPPVCPICAKPMAAFTQIQSFYCRPCGFLATTPANNAPAREDYYRREYYNHTHKLNFDTTRCAVYARDFTRALHRHTKPGKLLDFGCGFGHFLNYARTQGWDCSGIDIAPKAAEIARKRFGLACEAGGLETLQQYRSAFDVITLWNVFDHLVTPLDYLSALHAALKPGGTLIMRLFNLAARLTYLKLGERLHSRFLAKNFGFLHETSYTPAAITALLQRTGFADVVVFNSKSAGDAYGARTGIHRLIMRSVELLWFAAERTSGGRLLLAPSMTVAAIKTP